MVAISSLVACNKEPGSPRTNAPASPRAPSSTQDQDELWALAPAGAETGIVVSARGLAHLEGALHALRQFTATAPDLAPWHDRLARALEQGFGTREPNLATLGMTAEKGFAYYVRSDGSMVAILPVVDRDNFAKFATERLGIPPQMLGELCKEVRGVYACGLGVAPETFGGGTLRAKLELVAARGDIELVHSGPVRGKPVTAAGVLQLARGAGVLRVAIEGLPWPEMRHLTSARPRVHAETAGFAMMNVGALRDLVPPLPVVPGVSAAELVRSIAGPLTATIAAGAQAGYEITLPLSDPSAAGRLVASCDQLFPLRATVKDGTCRVAIPELKTSIEAWIEGNALRVGRKGVTSGPTVAAASAIRLSAIGEEIAGNDWFVASYGRGSIFAEVPVTHVELSSAPLPIEALLALRAVAMMNEVGIAVRVDAGVVHLVGSVRTAWSNPDDVLAKLVAITPQQIVEGKAATAGKAIADAAPGSPFAADRAAGFGGMVVAASALGVLASIAIPAFMDYTKKSKPTETSVTLERLAKNLKVAQRTHGEFPKGSVPPTPSRSCCAFRDGRCSEPAAWNHPIWNQLDFAMEAPHFFRYAYDSDGTTFMVRAIGDLDCDGNEITYTLSGSIDDQGNVVTNLLAPAPNAD